MERRFVPVRVSKYLGMYCKQDPLAWAIADRQKANSIVSNKFDDLAEAQAEADRLERNSHTVENS